MAAGKAVRNASALVRKESAVAAECLQGRAEFKTATCAPGPKREDAGNSGKELALVVPTDSPREPGASQLLGSCARATAVTEPVSGGGWRCLF